MIKKNTNPGNDHPATDQTNILPGYKAPAVHKAFQLLRTIANSQQSLGIAELAQKLGYSKSTTHGLVHALLREGVLTQGPGGRKLSLGPAIAELAFAHWDEEGAANLAQPILNDFRDTINETVILGIRIRNRVLIIATAEASEFLKISALIGSTIPLLGGAVGKVLLSQESLDNAAQLLEKYGLRRYTDQSIIDAQDYMQELERVRKQGYALDFDEYIRGIRAVAVALNNRTGLPAALWVVGISARMDAEKMQKIAQLAKEKALELRSVIDQNSPRTN